MRKRGYSTRRTPAQAKAPFRYRDVRSGTTHIVSSGRFRRDLHDTLHKSLYATVESHLRCQDITSPTPQPSAIAGAFHDPSPSQLWFDIEDETLQSSVVNASAPEISRTLNEEVEDVISRVQHRPPRTNRDNMKSEAANWRSRRTEFVEAYLTYGQQAYCHQCDCAPGMPGTIEVMLIDLKTLESRSYHTCRQRTNVQKLICDGFFPATPERPSIAFSFDLLRQFQAIQEHGKCSKEAFANGHLTFLEERYLRELISTKTRHHFAEHFHDAHAHWLTVDVMARTNVYQPLNRLHKALHTSSQELSYDDSKFVVGGLHEMCPACFGWTLVEKQNPASMRDAPAMIFCLDGNMQQKRFKRYEDTESRASHPAYAFIEPSWSKLPAFDPNSLSRSRPSMKGEARPEDDRGACERHFHAADKKSSSNVLVDEPGLVLASCRHGSQLRLFNMISGLGERRIYAVLLAHEIASTNPAAKPLIMYDIACQFQSYAQRMSSEILEHADFAVPALHGYAHQFSCQVAYHCRFKPGYGLSDGENVERNWSEMDRIVGALRTSTKTRRIHALDNFIRAAARRKRMTFGLTLANRWRSAQQRMQGAVSSLQSRATAIGSTYDEHIAALRQDLADRKAFYERSHTNPATRTKHAMKLEPIDILFEHLCLSDQRAGDISIHANKVHLSFRPSMSTVHAVHIDYDKLLERWQLRGDELLEQDDVLLEDILTANNWLDTTSNYRTNLFKEALGRKFSRELIELRQQIWIKWESNMQQTHRLRASKTGERGSTVLLRCINKASLALKNLITKHNEIVDEMRLLLPDQPCHRKLDQSRLSDEAEGPGFLLMPATVMKHRWLHDPSLTGALDHLSSVDRSTEELSLLVKESKRLLVWYTGRALTLAQAVLNDPLSQGPSALLLQTAFLEVRSFASMLSGIAREQNLQDQLQIHRAREAYYALCDVLQQPILHLNGLCSDEVEQDAVTLEEEDVLLTTLQASTLE